MFTKKVSIIIPVYNVEKEIHRCIESVINQTYENIEIILVDDGSTDDCPRICDEYGVLDNRVKVIHKENGGLSEARNYGINDASGDYIMLVDSDDEIELDACERLLEDLQDDVDIVVAEAYELKGNSVNRIGHTNLIDGQIYAANEYVTLAIDAMEWYAPSWLNIYKREYIVDNNLYFVNGLLHEDMEFLSRVFFCNPKVKYVEYGFYKYIVRNGSISHSEKAEKNGICKLFILGIWKERFGKIEDNFYRKMLYGYLVKHFLNVCGEYGYTKKSEELVEGINARFILKYGLNFREKVKGLLYFFSRKAYITLFKLENKRRLKND